MLPLPEACNVTYRSLFEHSTQGAIMSQHVFRTTDRVGQPVTVTVGYDRPLDYVFCTVFHDGEEDAPFYTNLDDEYAGTRLQEVNYYRSVLESLGIEVPETMFAEVESDQANVVGNRFVDHTK
jgi:hypothetical protein